LQQLAHEAKLAQEKEEEGSADEEAQEEAHQLSSNHDNHEHRKSTAKTPGESDEPMRVRLTRKYVEAVQALQHTALLCYQ
jgi:predicted DNA binding CopG/RHH family protein